MTSSRFLYKTLFVMTLIALTVTPLYAQNITLTSYQCDPIACDNSLIVPAHSGYESVSQEIHATCSNGLAISALSFAYNENCSEVTVIEAWADRVSFSYTPDTCPTRQYTAWGVQTRAAFYHLIPPGSPIWGPSGDYEDCLGEGIDLVPPPVTC